MGLEPIDKDKPAECMEGFKYIKYLVLNILDIKRAENYTEWINLGWCLYNIADSKTSKEKERLLNLWI